MPLYFQGDICLERVPDAPVSGDVVKPAPDGVVVLAEGELTGHRHVLDANIATLFRETRLARDMAHDLYIGHVNIAGPGCCLLHEEHAAIPLPPGTYRVRRQREYDGRERQRNALNSGSRLVRD